MKGISLYKCKCCEYHFAIEFGCFPDETDASCCPICRSEDVTFIRDVEVDLEVL